MPSTVLHQQAEQLEQLKLLLENELHLITAREPEHLIQLLKEKEALLDSVQQLDGQISDFLTDDNKASHADDIQRIEDLVKECQYRTEINAKAVNQGQLRIDHLRHLIVESRNKESMTYDKHGKTMTGNGGKGISA